MRATRASPAPRSLTERRIATCIAQHRIASESHAAAGSHLYCSPLIEHSLRNVIEKPRPQRRHHLTVSPPALGKRQIEFALRASDADVEQPSLFLESLGLLHRIQ